jgi:tetratricopeptide (TPR) repeat protein
MALSSIPLPPGWRGECYYFLGDFENAILDYQTAIEYRPEYAIAYTGLGCSLYRIGKKLEAKKAFTTAMYFDPSEGEEIQEFLEKFGD